jgi:hypothetical protein
MFSALTVKRLSADSATEKVRSALEASEPAEAEPTKNTKTSRPVEMNDLGIFICSLPY